MFADDAHSQALELCECAGEPVRVLADVIADTFGIHDQFVDVIDQAGVVVTHAHTFSLPVAQVPGLTRGTAILTEGLQRKYQVLEVLENDGFMVRAAVALENES